MDCAYQGKHKPDHRSSESLPTKRVCEDAPFVPF